MNESKRKHSGVLSDMRKSVKERQDGGVRINHYCVLDIKSYTASQSCVQAQGMLQNTAVYMKPSCAVTKPPVCVCLPLNRMVFIYIPRNSRQSAAPSQCTVCLPMRTGAWSNVHKHRVTFVTVYIKRRPLWFSVCVGRVIHIMASFHHI